MAELTKEQVADYKRQFTNWYREYVKHDWNVPPAILKEAIKQRMTAGYFRDYVRRHDAKWINTTEAQQRKRAIADLFRISLGPNAAKFMDKKQYKQLAEKYVRADPGKTLLLRGIFRQIIMKSKEFKSQKPEFQWWFEKNFQSLMQSQDPTGWLGKFDDERDAAKKLYQGEYAAIMGKGAVIPDELFNTAWQNDWDANGPDFVGAVQEGLGTGGTTEGGTTAYDTGEYAMGRNKEFTNYWESTLGIPIDTALMRKYARSNKDWDTFFKEDIRSSNVFNEAFPDYAAFEDSQVAQGVPLDNIDITDYFSLRNDFLEDYRTTFGDTNVNTAILSQALREGWSTSRWHKYVMENDTRATTTTEYKNKAAAFDSYWKQLFGDASVVDNSLQRKYVSSGFADPSQMWDEIKGTKQFKEQYTNWDQFAATQNAVGNEGIINDPTKYKEYKTDMQDAWSRLGMKMPEGYELNFFASGLTPDEVQYNLEGFAKTNLSYQWATENKADVATVAGTTNKQAGGDLRERMKKALEQHQQYAASSYNRFRTDESEQGNLIRKI